MRTPTSAARSDAPADGEVDEVDAPHEQDRDGDAAEDVGDVGIPRLHDAVPDPSQQAGIRAQAGERLQAIGRDILRELGGEVVLVDPQPGLAELREGRRKIGGVGPGLQEEVGVAGAFPLARGVHEEELRVVEGKQHVEANRRGAGDRRRHAGDGEVLGLPPVRGDQREALPQRVGAAEEALGHLVAQDDGVALGQGRGRVAPQQGEVEDLEESGIDEEELLVAGGAREGHAHEAVALVAPVPRAQADGPLHQRGEGLQLGRQGQRDHVGRGDPPHLRQGDLHVDAVDPVPLAVEAVEGPLLGGEAPGEEAEGHAQAEPGEVDGRVQAVAHEGAPGDDPVVAQHGSYSSLTNTSTPQ